MSVTALSAFEHHDTWLVIRNQTSEGIKCQPDKLSSSDWLFHVLISRFCRYPAA